MQSASTQMHLDCFIISNLRFLKKTKSLFEYSFCRNCNESLAQLQRLILTVRIRNSIFHCKTSCSDGPRHKSFQLNLSFCRVIITANSSDVKKRKNVKKMIMYECWWWACVRYRQRKGRRARQHWGRDCCGEQ